MASFRTSTTLAARIAELHLESATSDSKNLEWGLKQIQKAVQTLEDVADAWSARGPGQGEGSESLADAYGDVQRYVSFMKGREGAELLRLVEHLDKTKSNVSALENMRKKGSSESPLNGMTKRRAAQLVNKVILGANLSGFFRDEFWKPVRGIWKALESKDIPFGITKSDYEYDQTFDTRMPVRKVWEFEIPFTNERGREEILYGRVVAAGAGSVDNPLDVYDVTAYVN